MRIATLILGIFVVIIMLFQSCAVACLGSVSDSLAEKKTPSETTTGGAFGIMAAVCAIIGAAFVLKVPIVSIVAFLLGALLAGMGPQYKYADGAVWAWVLGILAVFSLFAYIGLRRERRAKMASLQAQQQERETQVSSDRV